MATISNGESGSSVRTKLNEIINKVEGVTSINNNIDISGQVGIGTSSPTASLHVYESGSGDGTIKIGNAQGGDTTNIGKQGSTAYGANSAGDAFVYTSTVNLSLMADGASSAIKFSTGGNTERMRIDSSGRVGIGVSNPSSYQANADDLVVGNLIDAGTGITIVSGTASLGSIHFADSPTGDDSYRGFIQYNHGSNFMRFATNASEAMRIDSSGNLLVGKESVGLSGEGSYFQADGAIVGTRDPYLTTDAVFYVNRLVDDGNLVNFYKDGTTVGSIASRSGVVSTIILDPRTPTSSTGAGLGTTSAKIVPADTSGLTDGKSDLGDSGNRFKDLYLSGGVVFGATGGAVTSKTLDDYEEGTWTPTAIGTSGSAILSEASGSYTKVGRMVTVNAEVDVSSVNTASGIVRFGGLPFTVADTISPTGIEASGSVSYWLGFTSAVNSLAVYAADSSTILDLVGNTSSTATSVNSIGWSNMGTGEIRFSITYFTS